MSDSTPIWVYIIIPILSAIVGYLTNVVAVWMTFHPTEFAPARVWQPEGQPFGLFGWQGIIPAKAVSMTQLLCDVFMDKVLDIDAIFSRVDPARVAHLMHDRMEGTVARVAREVAEAEAPDVWRALSPHVRHEMVQLLRDDAHNYVADLLAALQKHILDVLNYRSLVAGVVERDRSVLSAIFLRVGGKEFNFVKRSGIYFGFLFGLIQTIIYIFYKGRWVLPVAGFMVGYATNSVALKLIFQPAKPWRFGCYTVQGLFLKRQHEASVELARASKELFMAQDALWREVFTGAWSERWAALLEGVTDNFVLRRVNENIQRRLAAAMLLGEERLQRILRQVTLTLNDELPRLMPATYEYMDEVMDIEATIREALQAMPPEEFINVLRPAFEADEIKLILVGGVLGAVAGAVQQFGIFDYV